MIVYMAAIFCVLGLTIGQILFKYSAIAMSQSRSFFTTKTAISFLIAMCLYAITSLLWVWVLQRIELGRVYPLMALAFVFVPLGSYLVFGERFQAHYFIGVALIMSGIVFTVRG